MITLRKYFLLSLVALPVFMNAVALSDTDVINRSIAWAVMGGVGLDPMLKKGLNKFALPEGDIVSRSAVSGAVIGAIVATVHSREIGQYLYNIGAAGIGYAVGATAVKQILESYFTN